MIVAPDKPPHCAVHIFDEYVELYQAINSVGMTAPFPQSHAKSALGIALTEEQQSERCDSFCSVIFNAFRTRQLDAWTKELLATYQSMGDKHRAAVRQFLKLDLSATRDIQIQDKLANGLVEAPRAALAAASQGAAALKHPPSDSIFTDTSSQSGRSSSGRPPRIADDGSGSKGRGPSSPTASVGPVSKVSGSVASSSTSTTQHRRTSYAVKLSQSSSSVCSEPTRLKPDLKNMTAGTYYGESAVGSASQQNVSKMQVDGRKKDNLSTDEEKSTASPVAVDDRDMLQENLLRIGTTKQDKKKKRFLCCFYR